MSGNSRRPPIAWPNICSKTRWRGRSLFELSRLLAELSSEENSLAADRLRTVGLAIVEPAGPEPAEPGNSGFTHG